MTAHTVNNDTLTVLFRGEIDHHCASSLSADADALIRKYKPSTLILDFGGVTFCDSSGIALVLGRYKLMKNANGRTVLASLPAHVRKIFTLASLEKFVEIKNTGKDEKNVPCK